jgi:hypothetical protein
VLFKYGSWYFFDQKEFSLVCNHYALAFHISRRLRHSIVRHSAAIIEYNSYSTLSFAVSLGAKISPRRKAQRSLYVMSATVSPNVQKAAEEMDYGFDVSETPLLLDEDSWKLYTDFMNQIIKKEFTQKRKLVLPHDELVTVQAYLLNNSAVKGLPSPADVLSTRFGSD